MSGAPEEAEEEGPLVFFHRANGHVVSLLSPSFDPLTQSKLSRVVRDFKLKLEFYQSQFL